MSEFIVEAKEGEVIWPWKLAHHGVEHGAEKYAREEAVVFGKLGRCDEVDDGLALAHVGQVDR